MMISVNCIEELNRANSAAVGLRGLAPLNSLLLSKIEVPLTFDRQTICRLASHEKITPGKSRG